MKYLILFFVFSINVYNVAGQETSYFKLYTNGAFGGEYVSDIMIDDEGLKLFGTGRNSHDYGGVIKIRTVEKSNGELLNFYEGNQIDEHSYEIRNTILKNNKNCMTGIYSTGVGFESYDMFLYCIENNQLVLEKVFGVSGKFESGYGIVIDNNDDIIICGIKSIEESPTNSETMVKKLDGNGEEIWTVNISGSVLEYKSVSVTVDIDDNIYLIADDQSLFSGNQVGITKISPMGAVLWTKYYPGSASIAKEIQYNTSGNLIAAVTADYDGNGRTSTFMELDTDGNVLWTNSYASEVGDRSFAEKFIQTQSGGYATCVDIGHPVLVVTDSQGNAINVKHFEGYGIRAPQDLVELEDGSFAITGRIPSIDSLGLELYTVWLIKTDINGELVTSTLDEGDIPISLYPNPTMGNIQIEGIDYNKVYVVDAAGKMCATFTNHQEVDISQLPNGNYFLLIERNAQIISRAIVKK